MIHDHQQQQNEARTGHAPKVKTRALGPKRSKDQHRKTVLKTALKMLLAAALVLALWSYFSAGQAQAQRGINPRGNHTTDSSMTPPASDYNPDAVRAVLKSIHGFDRPTLDGASTDAAAILMNIIEDPASTGLERMQAVRALELYPSDETLAFIEARMDAAPTLLRRHYAISLRAFAGQQPERVTGLMDRLLGDADLIVRSSALGIAERLRGSASGARVQGILESRMAGESDPHLRKAMQKTLEARP